MPWLLLFHTGLLFSRNPVPFPGNAGLDRFGRVSPHDHTRFTGFGDHRTGGND
jgi:hypothetical protein